ncbi:hypothetical protein E1265_06645 [Streptomyces sp. 8K308]|uniref:hypothetical protein n=1 Tax=Streptomyces sp. 8K308 TaxID=2530388 RepID=UPI0010511481|nr:hypothetical protein [Streptomyces sp. 8K308]TDC25642.1 hypothetical protein E1265_06645 [Streptomyces sp. 8K308]
MTAGAALVTALAGPAVFSVETAGTAAEGAIPTVRPTSAGMPFGGFNGSGRPAAGSDSAAARTTHFPATTIDDVRG